MLRKLLIILAALFFIALAGITRAAPAPATAVPLIADQNGHADTLLLAVEEEDEDSGVEGEDEEGEDEVESYDDDDDGDDDEDDEDDDNDENEALIEENYDEGDVEE